MSPHDGDRRGRLPDAPRTGGSGIRTENCCELSPMSAPHPSLEQARAARRPPRGSGEFLDTQGLAWGAPRRRWVALGIARSAEGLQARERLRSHALARRRASSRRRHRGVRQEGRVRISWSRRDYPKFNRRRGVPAAAGLLLLAELLAKILRLLERTTASVRQAPSKGVRHERARRPRRVSGALTGSISFSSPWLPSSITRLRCASTCPVSPPFPPPCPSHAPEPAGLLAKVPAGP